MSEQVPESASAEVEVVEHKAYDIKVLGEKLKAAGLELAEDASHKLVVAVIDWVSESAKLSKTPYDDMALAVLPKMKEFILGQVAKIDGHAEEAVEPKVES